MRGLSATAVLALVLASGAAAASPPKNMGCGAGALVLSVSYHVQNDVDTGMKGNNWAFDTYHRSVRAWRKASGRVYSASSYDGEFTTLAGMSPGGTTQLPAGIRGTFKGSSVTTFRGKLSAGTVPLRGFVGSKDFMCSSTDVKGQCSGTWDWLRFYFTGISRFKYVGYAFTYHAVENGKGTWRDTLRRGRVRFSGDIRSKP
jgi:hypothetical protein